MVEKHIISKGDLNFGDLRLKLKLDVVEANPSAQSTDRFEDETLSIKYRWINCSIISAMYFSHSFLIS